MADWKSEIGPLITSPDFYGSDLPYCSYENDLLYKSDLLYKIVLIYRSYGIGLPHRSYKSDHFVVAFHEGYLPGKFRSNGSESSGSRGRAGEERNGGGGDGNQGIGGGGHREGIENERRGSRGRSHGGGNGDDDDNDRRGWVDFIVDGRRPMGPRPDRMPEILIPFNFQLFATVESLDITRLSVRVRIVRVVSLAFTSVALVCLSASIRQRGANPMLASILSCIGSVATFLGFISMIAMAFLASFIP